MRQRHRHFSALVLLGCVGLAIAGPVFVPQFLNEGVGRNIRHLPCVSRRTGETGVCMFAFTCARANGTHLGTCIDRFYFGSCCKIDEEPDVFPQDNTIDVDKPLKPYATSSSTIGTSLATSPSTPALESNDIPGNVDKLKPASSSTRPIETTTPKAAEPSKPKATKKPLVEATTQSIRLSTFQTVQNASEQRHTTPPSTTVSTTRRTQRPPAATTVKLQPTATTTTRPKPASTSSTRPSGSSAATATTLATKPSSTTSSKRPITTITTTTTTTQTKKPSSTRPSSTTTVHHRNVTSTSSAPTTHRSPVTTEPPRAAVTSATTLHTTQKTAPVTRFPPRNATTAATPRPASATANTTKVSETTTKPTTTRKPTTNKKPTKVTTKRPYTGTKRPSATPTKRPPPTTASSAANVTSASTTQSVKVTSTSPVATTIAAATTTRTTTKKPASQASSTKKPSPTATRRPATTTPATTTTITTTRRPATTTSKKNTTTSSIPASTATKKPTTTTQPPRPSSVPVTKQPVITTTTKPTTPKIGTTTTVKPVKHTAATVAATPKPTVASSTTARTTVRPTTKPTSTSKPTTAQRPISTTISNEVDADFDQSTVSGIVTWTSLVDESEGPTKTPSVAPTDTTETDWAPITTPDGWIIIQSPTTEEQPKPVVPTTEQPAKPVTEPTSTTTTTSSSTTTTTTTPKPRTTTTTQRVTTQPTTYVDALSTLATVTLAPEFTEPPYVPINMSNYKDVCGRRLFPESRIVGGDGSTFGKWPWQISLRQWRTSTYLHKCGAALLNENWAITAAHCVQNVLPSDLLLRIGEHDLGNEEEPYGFQERRVQIVASHPSFDARTFEFDLALMRFYEPVLPFQPNVLPICIPDDDEEYVGQTAFVTGWGRLYEDGPLPSVLQEVAVPVINNTVCEGMYRNAGYIEHIPHIFICAGWRKGGFDSCEGDSGGPLVIQRKRDKRWVLAGVISWGIGCAEPNQPGVYTRISEFREWINQILQF